MTNIVEIRISPNDITNTNVIREEIRKHSLTNLPDSFHYRIVKKNIDARAKSIWYVLKIEITPDDSKYSIKEFNYPKVDQAKEVYIIGAGPCGYFAALHLIRSGLKPIVIERGKDARERRKDLRAIQQEGIVNPHSNYCYGEGGAGTYSDGKLYTRSDKRGDIKDILDLLVTHGASEEILIDVHPHIGSNKLPNIVQNIRNSIIQHGGEVRFNNYLEDLETDSEKITNITINRQKISVDKIILCTGHSARDIFELLYKKRIEIQCKDFALGVRIEHEQKLIDEIQYRQNPRHSHLPAASYSLSCQINQKGVFSFCMCPGGLIVPSATSPGEIVVNGMSLSRRDSAFANSGLVTSVDTNDFTPFQKHKELQGMYFQKSVEQKVFQSGDGTQKAPAQRLIDFLDNKLSSSLPSSSYIPGLSSASIQDILPKEISRRLKEGILQFGKKIPKYLTNEAVILATESRTSSPVRIPRDKNNCQHLRIKNLYPAGEGAGYAGGILSAALDGIRVAEEVRKALKL